MGKEILTFGDIEIDKNKIYGNKSPNFLKDVAIRKFIINQYLTRFILLKKNYKYFLGYLLKDNKVKPLLIMLPKTSAYVKGSGGTN